MWIVRLALRRPYTFVVAAILAAILGGTAIFNTPTDIFPNINIPVIAVAFNYSGMSPSDMEERIVAGYERILTTTVNNIDHTESMSLYGIGVVKIYFQKMPASMPPSRKSPPSPRPPSARCPKALSRP